MIRKVSNFLDKHRLILVLVILFLFSLIFIGTSLGLFFTHNFDNLKCEKNVDDNICLNNNLEILKKPEEVKKEIFLEYKNSIESLKEEYNLPKFNYYTAYYYTLASNLDYSKNKRNMTLNEFFNLYSNTYNLETFYKNNNLFYQIFFPYKLV